MVVASAVVCSLDRLGMCCTAAATAASACRRGKDADAGDGESAAHTGGGATSDRTGGRLSDRCRGGRVARRLSGRWQPARRMRPSRDARLSNHACRQRSQICHRRIQALHPRKVKHRSCNEATPLSPIEQRTLQFDHGRQVQVIDNHAAIVDTMKARVQAAA